MPDVAAVGIRGDDEPGAEEADLADDVFAQLRGFVDALSRNPRDRAIVQATLNLGRDLGTEVVAEGVEREEEARLLRTMGCRKAQGFLFARPLPAREARDFMLAHANGTPAAET